MMNLGEFFDKPRVILAPMAGVTDIAMRSLCLEQGADLTYTEMVSAKALSFANEKTRHLITLAEGENRVVVQMFGHEPKVMADQASWIAETVGERLAYLDINMGCPARKIAGKGDGSALMRDSALASGIVRAVVGAVQGGNVSVTCKFRRGYFEGVETAPEFARILEDAGVSAMAVHGRYAQQMYRGTSDRGVIKRVKDAVSVPVIGNGDIRSGEDALSMLQETGCDALMIGRAAQGNPWIFSEVSTVLNGALCPPPPSYKERIEMAKRHAELLTHREGRNIVRMRKHAAWYMTGLPGASFARGKFNECVTLDDFYAVFDEVLDYARAFYTEHPEKLLHDIR